jgi:hypothetical protein
MNRIAIAKELVKLAKELAENEWPAGEPDVSLQVNGHISVTELTGHGEGDRATPDPKFHGKNKTHQKAIQEIGKRWLNRGDVKKSVDGHIVYLSGTNFKSVLREIEEEFKKLTGDELRWHKWW